MSTGALAVAAGHDFSILLKQDGSVWATGENNYGQLGDGSKISRSRFVNVLSSGALAVAAGAYHNMVRLSTASGYGQLTRRV